MYVRTLTLMHPVLLFTRRCIYFMEGVWWCPPHSFTHSLTVPPREPNRFRRVRCPVRCKNLTLTFHACGTLADRPPMCGILLRLFNYDGNVELSCTSIYLEATKNNCLRCTGTGGVGACPSLGSAPPLRTNEPTTNKLDVACVRPAFSYFPKNTSAVYFTSSPVHPAWK